MPGIVNIESLLRRHLASSPEAGASPPAFYTTRRRAAGEEEEDGGGGGDEETGGFTLLKRPKLRLGLSPTAGGGGWFVPPLPSPVAAVGALAAWARGE